MESDRNFAGIANSMENADGQAMQHFMSNSPWSGQGVYEQIQAEIKEKPELHPGSASILDEYADEKAGGQSAGALRQYNGRMGKVDMCQLAVALSWGDETRHKLGIFVIVKTYHFCSGFGRYLYGGRISTIVGLS